jgi:hypothetical protein
VNRPVPEDQPQASAQYPAPEEDRGAPQNPSQPGAQEQAPAGQEEYVPDPANTGPATSPGARHLTPAEEAARAAGAEDGAQG